MNGTVRDIWVTVNWLVKDKHFRPMEATDSGYKEPLYRLRMRLPEMHFNTHITLKLLSFAPLTLFIISDF